MLNQDITLTILLGNGDGTFTTAPAPHFFVVTPAAITVGDFNHDGHLDLALVDDGDYYRDGPSISILLGTGDGGFAPGTQPQLDSYPASIVTGDFNGDGNLDFAVAGTLFFTPGGFQCMGLGDGKGGFTGLTDVCSALYGEQLALGDFNADGIPDLAVSGADVSGVALLLGKGDGTFLPPIFGNTGQPAARMAVADYNGDGLPDLALANGDGSVSVLTAEFTGISTATASSVTIVGTGTHKIYAAYPGSVTTGRSVSKIIDLAGYPGHQ